MRLTKVLIDGIDIGANESDTDALISYDVYDNIDNYGIQEKYGTITVDYEKYLNLIGNFNKGLSCVITRGNTTRTDETILYGFITNINKDSNIVELTVRNDFWRLTRKEMTYSYDYNIDDEAGELSAIWENVVGVYGGLTTSAVASGTADNEIRKKWPISNKKISDVSDDIVKLLGWVQYYRDYNQTAYLEPEGTSVYGTNLVVGENVINNLVWEDDIESAINIVKVVGSSRRDWSVQTFSGDDSETDFTLTYTPKDTEIYIGSDLQVRGVAGAAADFDYTVDEQNKKIIFVTAPTTGTDNITVNYSRDVPQAAIARSQDSIDELNFESQQTYYLDDLREMDDIKQKANSILNAFAFGFTSTELEVVDIVDLYVAMQVSIIDDISNRSEILTVKKIHYRYPENTDYVEVGNKRFMITQLLNDFKKRLETLEQQSITADEFLQHLVYALIKYSMEIRYHKILTRDTTPDGIWGLGFSDGAGNRVAWGASGAVWQGSYTNSQVTSFIAPGALRFREYGYDTTFEYSGTATWSTAVYDTYKKGKISFTSGQSTIIGPISKGFTPNNLTLSRGTLTGSLLIEASADGMSTWETITNNTNHVFSSADTTGLYIRLTENNSSTATLENTYNENERYSAAILDVQIGE